MLGEAWVVPVSGGLALHLGGGGRGNPVLWVRVQVEIEGAWWVRRAVVPVGIAVRPRLAFFRTGNEPWLRRPTSN